MASASRTPPIAPPGAAAAEANSGLPSLDISAIDPVEGFAPWGDTSSISDLIPDLEQKPLLQIHSIDDFKAKDNVPLDALDGGGRFFAFPSTYKVSALRHAIKKVFGDHNHSQDCLKAIVSLIIIASRLNLGIKNPSGRILVLTKSEEDGVSSYTGDYKFITGKRQLKSERYLGNCCCKNGADYLKHLYKHRHAYEVNEISLKELLKTLNIKDIDRVRGDDKLIKIAHDFSIAYEEKINENIKSLTTSDRQGYKYSFTKSGQDRLFESMPSTLIPLNNPKVFTCSASDLEQSLQGVAIRPTHVKALVMPPPQRSG